MTLRIDVLGTPQIDVDGAPLRVDTRKATALLAYLAVTGGPQARDLLVELLWPDTDPDRGRSALRRTLSTLRSALGQRWLAVTRSAVALDVGPDAIDVRRFRRLAAAAGGRSAAIACLSEAVALHRGDLLAGFGLRDSVVFDDWQRSATAELRGELELALDRLVAALAEAGRSGEAIPHAQRRLALDPIHEPAHRALILLYAATGHRAEALNQYRECVRVLDRELGVRPLSETSDLYDAVNEGVAVRWPATPAARAHAPAAPEPGFVGREEESGLLLDEVARSRDGGRLVLLEGEAGVGKTRLGGYVLAAARATGSLAVACRSHEGESALPFGLLAGLLHAALTAAGPDRLAAVPDHWRAEAARLVPDLGAGAAPADGVAAQQRLHEGLAQVVLGLLAADEPSVLFLDDLHFADRASLEALAYLCRRLQDQQMLVLAAWRPEDTGPDHAPLRRLAARSVRLGRLSRGDVERLAAQAGAREHAARLFDETDGLPLFVVEYLAALSGEEPPDSLPRGVRELLTSRVESAGETASQLLTAAAVIGRSFDVDTLRSASGRSEEETVAGVEELMRRGLVLEREAAYDFAHEQLVRLVYERASLARRRLLHRRVAESLAGRRGDAALVARHLQSAGLDADAAAAYRAAGDRARSLHAYAEALDAYASALALGRDDAAGLHEAIGDLHTLRGEYRAAISAYEAAAALADAAALAGIEHKLGRVHDRRGEPDLAESHLTEALRLGGESARIQADRSLVAHRRGDDERAGELAERALDLGRAAEDVEAVAQAENILGMLTGETDHLERSVELAETVPDRSVLVAALNNLALARARRGEYDRAIALTERALRLCSEQGDRHREAALTNNLADLLHRTGHEDEAMEHLKRAVVIFAEIGADDGGMQPEVWKLVEW